MSIVRFCLMLGALLAPELHDLFSDADLVVLGRVRDVSPATAGAQRATLIALDVETIVKGAAPRRVIFGAAGGDTGGVHQTILGVPQFRRGERAVVFLRRVSGGWRILPRGKLSVTRGAGGDRVPRGWWGRDSVSTVPLAAALAELEDAP